MKSLIQFGAHKLPLKPGATPAERHRHSEWMLSRVFNLGTAVAFVGSGCSRALGYPSWRGFTEGLIDATIDSLKQRAGASSSSEALEQFTAFKNSVSGDSKASAKSLMFYISACRSRLREEDPESYTQYIRATFAPDALHCDAPHNPYRFLLELPITRFVTTNYDCGIELALADRGDPSATERVPWRRFAIEGKPADDKLALSFTQEDCYQRELARFALARVPGNRNMVFHCHGRWDRQRSIIASEADYQEWYLADRGDVGHAFRQTMELLLQSNPLLFVGYGLRDEDLLRPLRYLGAVDPDSKASRPLFALLPTTDADDDFHHEEFLFERYGVKVIPYLKPGEESDDDAWSKALCSALRKLRLLRDQSTTQWVQKPLAKKSQVQRKRSKRSPLMLGLDGSRLTDLPLPDHSRELLDRLQAGVLCLIGPSGVGKSVTLARLVTKLTTSRKRHFSKIFYLNAHYESEALTGLDLALDFLDAGGGGSRHRRLLRCLKQVRNLLIVDGCERLLKQPPTQGHSPAFNANTRRLFEVLADKESASTVIFSGRIMPTEFLKLEETDGQRMRRHELNPLQTSDLLTMAPFSRLNEIEPRWVSALCSLLDGHYFGLLLAARFLERDTREKLSMRAEALHRKLSNKAPKKRLAEMIQCTLDELNERTEGLGSELLSRLAFFRGPVYSDIVELCAAEALRPATRAREGTGASAPIEPPWRELIAELEADGLLFPAAVDATEPGEQAFVVHESVSTFFSQLGYSGRGNSLPSFAQPGSTTASSGVEPSSRTNVTDLFEAIHRKAVQSAEEETDERALRLCRNAFSLMRSQMECGSVPRWTDYDRYTHFGIRVAELAKRLSPDLWTYATRLKIAEVEDTDAPLYIAELAWLYSDVGLALFSEGLMADAFSVWEQAYEINRVLEGAVRPGETVAESLLNLAHCLIELGRIQEAEAYLDDAEEISAALEIEDLSARLLGFRGLVAHLKGNLEQADLLYERCLKAIDIKGNPRAASFFNLYRCLLSLEHADLDRAQQFGRSARAFAEVSQSFDLLAYARIAEADLHAMSDRVPMARQAYKWALEEAHRFKGRKIEALIALKLSELGSQQGDTEGARRQALRGVGLANELGLGLLQTRGLITLGRATLVSGDATLGNEYLRIAKDQASLQNYWLRHREAEWSSKDRFERRSR